MVLGELGGVRIERRGLGDPLLEQQHGRLEQGIRLESLLHRAVQEQMGQRQETHALVMGHEGPNHGARLSARQTRRSVVDRFVEAIPGFKAFSGESLEVQTRLLGRHHQRQRRGIGRNHQVLGEPAFEPQAGHAKGAVLVVEMHIDGIVTAFRNAPRHRAFFPILDLPGHSRLAGLVEQRVFVRRHHQERHQVFEHRTAPREEDRFSTGGREQTSQGEPALLRQLSLRNRDETGKPRFRSQEIVVAGVPPVFADIVADRQQMTRLVEQEIIFHLGKVRRIAGQAL